VLVQQSIGRKFPQTKIANPVQLHQPRFVKFVIERDNRLDLCFSTPRLLFQLSLQVRNLLTVEVPRCQFDNIRFDRFADQLQREI